MSEKFFKDGFKNDDFFIGIVIIVGLILLFSFGEFIMMGMAIIIGIVCGVAIVGFIGKGASTVKNKYKSSEEESVDEAEKEENPTADSAGKAE